MLTYRALHVKDFGGASQKSLTLDQPTHAFFLRSKRTPSYPPKTELSMFCVYNLMLVVQCSNHFNIMMLFFMRSCILVKQDHNNMITTIGITELHLQD